MNPNVQILPGLPGGGRILAVRANGGTAAPAVLAAIDEWSATFKAFRDETSERLTEIEQRQGDGHLTMPGAAASGRSPGAALAGQIMKSEAFEAVRDKRQTKTGFDVTSAMLLPAVEANSITRDGNMFDLKDRQPGIVTSPQRRTWLRQRFQTVPTTGDSVTYHRMVTFTNAAAPQGGGSPHLFEGVSKPETSMTFEDVTEKVQTVAHWIRASKQILSDAPMLALTIDNQLRYGIELAVESQILTGNGTGSNFSGLTKSGNYTAFTPTSGDTALESLSRAIAAIASADGQADLIIMHPADWAAIERLKASTAGTFLLGNPAGNAAKNVWGVPVHLTPAMTQGKFIVMSTMAVVIFDRSDASVVVGWQDDDFTKNLVTILAEARLTIGVQQPALVRYGDLVL